MASGLITSWQIEGEKVDAETDCFFLGSKITMDGDCNHEIRRWLLLGRKAMTNLDDVLGSKDTTLPTKVIRWWELDRKEGRRPKNWNLQSLVLEKTLESPLDSTEIKPVNLKGNQPWIFISRSDAEAPILWPPVVTSWPFGKVPDAEKDWGQQEKRASEDEMAGWHHWCNRHELGQTWGDDEGQGQCVALHGVANSQTQLGDWTTTTRLLEYIEQSSLCCICNLSSHWLIKAKICQFANR